jgi:Tfp pilus assembly protein PilO
MLLFGPVPGGIEFAVILLIIVVFLTPFFLTIAAYRRFFESDSEHLDELEAEVEELRERVEE